MNVTSFEDSYPLSPMQQGMLFHSRYAPRSGAYIQQLICALNEDLDVSAFKQAWQRVVGRHPVLRTTFRWDGLDEPRQEVHRFVEIPWEEQDWRSCKVSEQEDRLAAYLETDRQKEFELPEQPLMRLALFRVGKAEYRFIWTSHHALLDGRSYLILAKEVFAYYDSFCRDGNLLLTQPRPYRDYIDWLNQQDFSKHENFWRPQLKGFKASTPFGIDRPSSAASAENGKFANQKVMLSHCLTEALKRIAREYDLTLNTLLLGAWALLLSRYSGQEEVIFGATRGARHTTLEGAQDMVGLFINTLPIRVRAHGHISVESLLRELRTQWIKLRDYEHTPLVSIHGWSDVPPGQPLFESLVVFENYQLNSTLRGQEGNWQNREFELLGTTNYPIVLSGELGEDLLLEISYNCGRFEEDSISRMLGHLQNLLEGMAADPERKLSDLPFLTNAERHQLLVEWNDTEREFPKDKCIHEFFEEQVKRTPDAVAVIFEDKRLTYRELNSKANQLAHYLRKLGVKPEVLVGLCLERSLEMIVGVLGILKAGGAYVPMDPEYPKDRLEFMLRDTKAPVLLTQQKISQDLPEYAGQNFCLDQDWHLIAGESEENVKNDANPNNLAYVIYTSGSTGNPKGVLITHSNLVNAYFAWEEAYQLQSAAPVFLQMANIAFDVFSADWVRALCSGGKFVLCPTDFLLDAPQLYALMRREKVDCADFVPLVMRNLINYLDDIGQTLDFMRLVVVGSEVWYAEEYQKIQSLCGPNTRVINSYGVTEATIDSSFFRGEVSTESANRAVPIGRPYTNTQLYIVDRHLQLAPVGVPGELCVSGAGLARGYLNRAELTAEKFIADPFSTDPGARLYKTGDLARYLPDGNIEFLGRIDNQVKIRGYRIELGEIEVVLDQHSAVRESVVLAREDNPGDRPLVAYVVVAPGSAPTMNELRSFLKQKLPEYMVPSAYVFLESFPVTPNGKLNRKILPAPDQSRPELDVTFGTVRTPVEEILASIWADVLKLDRVGIHDNFFDLGGHSLLATQVISRVNSSFQSNIQLRRLFETPTVAGLATSIDASRGLEEDRQRIPSIVPVPRNTEISPSFAQQRLWFLDRMDPGSTTYNVPAAFRLTGEFNVQALEQSLSEIVRRHEVLRTVFSTVNGEPVQKILPSLPFALTYTDISDHPEKDREQVLPSLVGEDAERPFDLSHGPLLRAQLLRLAPQDHVLVLNMHHIVSDGWSMGVLFRELSVLYEAYLSEKPNPLPELPIQYADYAVWQKQWLQGEELEHQLSYWRKQLDSLSTLQLPTDHTRSPVQTYRGASKALDLSAQLSESIKALSQREGVTLFMTLLAAFQLLLSRYCGQSNVAVGSPIAGRTRQETEALIGFFVNTLVLRTELSNNPTFKDLLRQVRETTLEAYDHQDLPFEKLVEELHPDRNLSNSPLFQVMFVFQNNSDQPLEFERLTVKPIRTASHVAKFDLTLTMAEMDGKLRGSVNYNTDLFDASTMERMVGHFQMLLEGVVANPQRRVSDLPIMTESEKHQLLVEWNDTKSDCPTHKCIHELFETQVDKSPDAVAVVFEDQQLTYQKLNTKANQLAHYLRKLGVGPEILVGLCMEPSLEMVVGLLGVLKAGGAYLPLDPKYPTDRLEFMLEDTQAIVLLTQAGLKDRLPKYAGKKLALDSEWDEVAPESGENPHHQVTAKQLAYVIFTSGSTGKPKAVMIEHRGLTNYLNYCVTAYPIDAGRGSLVHSSIAFDATITGLYAPLLVGRTVYLLRETDGLEALAKRLCQLRDFSVVKITPAHLALLSEQIPAEEAKDITRCFVIGGENLVADQIAFWQKNAPATLLFNEYGPTENVVGCIVYQASGWRGNGSVPIGRAIPNTAAYVLDQYGQPVPIGVSGELYLGGAGVARGYLNRDELTREKFIADPFSAEPGARVYRTGDVARYLPDGNIEFIGRLDNQVKIRGYRIELGEIESVLCDHPAIREAVALAREDTPRHKRLVAYLVSNQQPQPPIAVLRNFLKEHLPDYMVPEAFVFLDRLPLTQNGKVDRRALPAPDHTRPELEKSFVAPRDALELRLSKVWGKVLEIKPIGVRDNFFELGGHSLLAIRLLAQIEKKLGKHLPLAALFQAPTIEDLASLLRQEDRLEFRSSLLAIQPNGRKLPFFCVQGTAALANYLGLDQPFYALQPPATDGRKVSSYKVEDIAADFVKEIRAVQPRGPYLLGGYSFGGKVAFEMAHQLRQQGHEVRLLALLDPGSIHIGKLSSPVSTISSTLSKKMTLLCAEFRRRLRKLAVLAPQQKLTFLWTGVKWRVEGRVAKILREIKKIACWFYLAMGRRLPPGLRSLYFVEVSRRAARRYVPQVYPGRVIVFPTEDMSKDERSEWERLAGGGFELHAVPGNHSTVLKEPNVRLWAEKLKTCLVQAQAAE